ncbi:hypothetical protein PDO_1112 [Rhizobium sp. PDO1-076]|uniref:hypothetical protein n=1 Tax=Rhizobium sp. PDO1-076 TaxID=1125979 RepID=UPI00024E3715|nr:hypothetical protein [Rhizobium sp. PDO1-076]EHS53402.1 hypothetical protein PDO_1112 [Rhizobium sp. PDO1-076]
MTIQTMTPQTSPIQTRPIPAQPTRTEMLPGANHRRHLPASRARLAVAIVSAALAACTTSATAQMAFSPACTAFTALAVALPQNAIVLSKHPVPHPAGDATVFSINGLNNYVVPAGSNSCVIAAPDANDVYCFQARNDLTITHVGIAAIVNPGGLTACQ